MSQDLYSQSPASHSLGQSVAVPRGTAERPIIDPDDVAAADIEASARAAEGSSGHAELMQLQSTHRAAELSAKKAKKLVLWSHLLGWGGLIALFIAPFATYANSRSGMATGIVAGVCCAAMLAGAIIGQVGRAMQGRVI